MAETLRRHLPFFAVSATSPLLQRWLSFTDHPAARDPYFLYAASNLGSLIALLSYPVVIEPLTTLQGQRYGWSLGYLAFALLMGALAWRSARHADHGTADLAELGADGVLLRLAPAH